MRRLHMKNTVPETVEHSVTMKDPKKPLQGDIPIPLQVPYPHQLFSWVATKFPNVFEAWKGDWGLVYFWNKVLDTGDPHLHDHPVQARANWKTKAIPIVLYGGSARPSRRNALEITAWAPLLGGGPSAVAQICPGGLCEILLC